MQIYLLEQTWTKCSHRSAVTPDEYQTSICWFSNREVIQRKLKSMFYFYWGDTWFVFEPGAFELSYMRCVASEVQSGRYRAPMASALSLSSPRKGFWKPLRTNTTPSMIRFKASGSAALLLGLAFGSGLDLGLSFFFSSVFWPGEARNEMTHIWELHRVNDHRNQFTFKTFLIERGTLESMFYIWTVFLSRLLLGLRLVLALDFGVVELGLDEPVGRLDGGPGASRRSLLNSNFLFTGA